MMDERIVASLKNFGCIFKSKLCQFPTQNQSVQVERFGLKQSIDPLP
jgi:hypothetical protein